MSLDVVWGRVKNRMTATVLVDALKRLSINDTLYLGYPVLPQVESSTTVEAFLVSMVPGLVAFKFPTSQFAMEEFRGAAV